MTTSHASAAARRQGSRAGVAAGSLLQTISRVLALAFGVVLAGYLTRRLAVADYGSYAVSIAVAGGISSVLATATAIGVVRLMAAHAHGRRFAVAMLQAAGGAGVLAWALVALTAPVVAIALRTPVLSLLLQIVAADIPLAVMASVYTGVLTGQGRFAAGASSFVLAAAARLLLAVVFLEWGLGVVGAAASVPLASAAQLGFGWVTTRIPVFSRERVPFRELWGHTRLQAGSSLALRLSQRMDLLAVKLLAASATTAGYYAGAQSLAFGPLVAFQGSPGVVTQAIAHARAKGEHDVAVDVAVTFVRTTMIYGGLIAAMGGLANDAIVLVLGEAFAPAGPVLTVLLWATAFRVMANSARGIVAAVGEQTGIVRALALAVVAGAAVYLAVIPFGGAMAAAGATAALALAVCVLSTYAGLRLVQAPFPWVSLARVSVATVVAALAATVIPGRGPAVVLRAVAVTGVYCAALIGVREWRPKPADARMLVESLRLALGLRS